MSEWRRWTETDPPARKVVLAWGEDTLLDNPLFSVVDRTEFGIHPTAVGGHDWDFDFKPLWWRELPEPPNISTEGDA